MHQRANQRALLAPLLEFGDLRRRELLGLRRSLTFRSRPYRHADWFDLYETVRHYHLDADTAALIATSLLITVPEDEQFRPGQSQQLADLVPGRAEVLAFTAAEGANYHCQPLGRMLTV